MEKTRFGFLGWPLLVTQVDGQQCFNFHKDKKQSMPVFLAILTFHDFRVWVLEQQPPVHALALGMTPSINLVSSESMSLLQRQAQLGFRDVSVIFINRVFKFMPAGVVKVKPTTVMEKVAALCCWLWPLENDVQWMLDNRVEPKPKTKPLVTTAHTLTDEVLDSTDKREMQSEQQKEANKECKCLVFGV